MSAPGLILHCGAGAVERRDVFQIPTPASTRTWAPLPHGTLLVEVEHALLAHNLQVTSQAHSLTPDGSRYFGLLGVAFSGSTRDIGWVLGVRNSHDKSFPAGIVAGMQVLVCDNLSFSGEVKLTRKHTRHILRDLPGLVEGGIRRITGHWVNQDKRVEAYRRTPLDDKSAHDVIIRAADHEAIGSRQIPRVLREWREPSHPEFKIRSAWSLFNAFTEVLKDGLESLPRKTEALHGLFDRLAGVSHSLN